MEHKPPTQEDIELLDKALKAVAREAKEARQGMVRVRGMVRIAGVPGIGKSTVLEQFGPSYHKILEPAESNPFLAGAYEEPHRYNLAIQVHLITTWYYSLHKSLAKGTDRLIATDYGEPRCFSMWNWQHGLFPVQDYIEFYRFAAILDNYVPGLVILLSGPQAAYKRARKRGREPDKILELSFYEELEELYKERLRFYSKYGTPVITLDWSKPDMAAVSDVLVNYGYPPLAS